MSIMIPTDSKIEYQMYTYVYDYLGKKMSLEVPMLYDTFPTLEEIWEKIEDYSHWSIRIHIITKQTTRQIIHPVLGAFIQTINVEVGTFSHGFGKPLATNEEDFLKDCGIGVSND